MATTATFKRKLKAANKTWKSAKKQALEDSGFESLEPGIYVTKLVKAEISESEASQRLQVVFVYEVLQGEFKGSKQYSYNGIETEDGQRFLARDLARFGYELPDTLEEVQNVLDDIVEAEQRVKIRIKVNGEFTNTYIQKVLDQKEAVTDDEDDEPEETEEAEEAEEAEDGDNEEEAEDEDEEAEEETEEEAEEEDEPEEDDLVIGSNVAFTFKGEEYEGVVVSIDPEAEKAVIKAGTKKYKVSFDKMELLKEATPPKKTKKKTTRKKA